MFVCLPVGFPKNDYAPRTGRKGRVIRDDPRKYPGRDDLGPLKVCLHALAHMRTLEQDGPAMHSDC